MRLLIRSRATTKKRFNVKSGQQTPVGEAVKKEGLSRGVIENLKKIDIYPGNRISISLE